jgi:hypothetical protein
MDATLLAIVQKLDPSSLMLVVVLLGVWKLIRDAMVSFKGHIDSVGTSLERMADDCHELRKDMSAIAKQVAVHEVRIDMLEKEKTK